MIDAAAIPPRHYPTGAAKCADLVVHVIGLSLAVLGGCVLLALSIQSGRAGLISATCVYAAGLIAMLSFSAAYNFAPATRRPYLHRWDHAGIFLMIAASYTPFTTQVLEGAWAIGMTSAVWAIAGLGIIGKLFSASFGNRIWVGIYVALGWIVIVAFKPLAAGLPTPALWLLAAGGVIYTIGVIFHINRSLTFSYAIWHGHVVVAAALHWFSILLGVVLIQAA